MKTDLVFAEQNQLFGCRELRDDVPAESAL
jgi:hypothetical protein